MIMQTQTSPTTALDTVRERLARVGQSIVPGARQLGITALRSSADTLLATAEKLDGLAARLEESTPPAAAETTGDASLEVPPEEVRDLAGSDATSAS
jgi:hypothetical protein